MQQGAMLPASATARGLGRFLPAAIFIVTYAAFFPALYGDFVSWDDWANVRDNPHFRGLGPEQLRWMFTTSHMGHYQPLSWVSLAVDWYVYGLERPWGYHLTNNLLHAASAAVFYLIAVRLLRLATRRPEAETSEGSDDRATQVGAVVAALLFAVHPLRVESVAWITERRDVLSSLFYLLTIVCYLRYATGAAGRRGWWFALTVVCFVCALLAKVMSVSLPVILLVLDVYPLRRIGGQRGWVSAAGRRVLWEKAVLLALTVAPMVLAVLSQRGVNSMIPLRLHGIPGRLAVCAYGVVFYLRKSLWPVDLSPLYELPAPVRPLEIQYLAAAVVGLGITLATVALRRRFPAGLAVWVCYLVILFPVLGLLQNGPQIAADRYSYLSCLGPALLAGGGVRAAWLGRWSIGGRAGLCLTCGTVVAVFGVMTWQQCGVWRDSLALWTQAVEVEPDCGFCNSNLGQALEAAGREAEAERVLRHAITVRPRIETAHYMLAGLLRKRGELDAAVGHYRAALEIQPDYVEAMGDLATSLYVMGEADEAVRLYRKVIELAPRRAAAYRNLAGVLAQRGEWAEAEAMGRRATELAPGNAEGYYNYGGVLYGQGKLGEAERAYRRALEINPAYVEAVLNLAVLLRQSGRADEAAEVLRAGIGAAPRAVRLRRMLEEIEGG